MDWLVYDKDPRHESVKFTNRQPLEQVRGTQFAPFNFFFITYIFLLGIYVRMMKICKEKIITLF